jgi:transposase
MAARRLSMRKIKEVLRLHHDRKLSTREIAKSLTLARSTVSEYLNRAARVQLSWPLPTELDEASLEQRLFPAVIPIQSQDWPMPAREDLHRELKRKGVTLQLLWYE